ncbi:hypothetical protein ACHMW5_09020 [Azospirillum melinis]
MTAVEGVGQRRRSAAIADAGHNATGKRLCDLSITLDKILEA